MNPEDLLIGEGDGVVSAVKSFLGVKREAFVCPDCHEPCRETHAYDAQRAAFDGGKSPAWMCPECSKTFVREVDDTSHTLDLYGRDPPQ